MTDEAAKGAPVPSPTDVLDAIEGQDRLLQQIMLIALMCELHGRTDDFSRELLSEATAAWHLLGNPETTP